MWLLVVNLYSLILLATAAAGISVTISWSAIFRPLRMWILSHEDNGGAWEFLANLITCHYCLGHYVALLFFILCPAAAIPIAAGALFTWIINYFLLVTITSFISTSLMLLIVRLKNLQ